MTKTEHTTTVISEGRSPDGTGARRRSGRSEEAGMVPSSLMIFMDAANNINGQDFTVDNVRNYTLRKFNVDVTENILSSRKPTTRAEILAERRRMGASNEQGTTLKESKRKFEPTLGSPTCGSKKKNVGRDLITPASMDDGQESLEIHQGAGDDAENPDGESTVVKAEKLKAKGSYQKNVKNFSEEVKSKRPAVGTKEKIAGRVKISLASRDKGQESPEAQTGAGDNAENPDGEHRMVKTEKQKAKGNSKKNVKNSLKEVKSKRQAVGPKKKSVGRLKIPPASLEGAGSQQVRDGENAGNSKNNRKMAKLVKSKARGRPKKNVQTTVVNGKKRKA